MRSFVKLAEFFFFRGEGEKKSEMYPGKWTDEIVTNPLCGQMKKGHTQLADRSLTT